MAVAATVAGQSPVESVSDDVIRPGDWCVLQITQGRQLLFMVKRGSVTQTKHGALPHDYLIGRRFGCRVTTKNERGFVHVLRLTPELWTLNLRHRTQVIYHHDISLIIMMLDLTFGDIVIESGTGSGSLSHALIRAVMPYGHLFTYEFHKERAQQARTEFNNHGVGDHVTVTHADVLVKGFGLQHQADAVVLDLPMSHRALVHAKKAMKPGARICAFCPCIEQVQRICSGLHDEGFSDIQTFECANRELQPTTLSLPQPNFTCVRRTMVLETKNGEAKKESNPAELTDSRQPCVADKNSTAEDGQVCLADGDSTNRPDSDDKILISVTSTANVGEASPITQTGVSSSQADCTETPVSICGVKRPPEQEEGCQNSLQEPEKKRPALECREDSEEGTGRAETNPTGQDEEVELKEGTTDDKLLPKRNPYSTIAPLELSSLRIVDMGKRTLPAKSQKFQKSGSGKEDEPVNMSLSAAIFRTAFRAGKMPGHTGYLTFATCEKI